MVVLFYKEKERRDSIIMDKKEQKRTKRWPVILAFILGMIVSWFFLVGFHSSMGTGIQQTYALNRAIRIIERFNYKEVEDENLYVSAIRGATAALEDPYAAYYTNEEYSKLMQSQSGEYEGIGITVGEREDGTFYVASVYDQSPAAEAGIKKEDTILAMMGQTLASQSGEEVSRLIATHTQNEIAMTLQRGDEIREVVLKKQPIHIERVHSKIIDDTLIIRVDEFHGDCVEEFEKALNEGKEKDTKQLIIDLRNNPGGGLDESKGIANLLLDEGVLLSQRTRNGDETFTYTDKGKEVDWPIAVLMNENSASASEMLAGALQDRENAIVVGTQSYGKGIVQSTFSIPFAGHIKITTAGYYTPNGQSIHEKGITPDVIIDLSQDDKDKSISELTQKEDVQLQAAIDALNTEN